MQTAAFLFMCRRSGSEPFRMRKGSDPTAGRATPGIHGWAQTAALKTLRCRTDAARSHRLPGGSACATGRLPGNAQRGRQRGCTQEQTGSAPHCEGCSASRSRLRTERASTTARPPLHPRTTPCSSARQTHTLVDLEPLGHEICTNLHIFPSLWNEMT